MDVNGEQRTGSLMEGHGSDRSGAQWIPTGMARNALEGKEKDPYRTGREGGG